MSAEATGWVFRHSPLRGSSFAVHLAIADSVNDQYGNEFWMAAGGLADKARCDRATVFRTIDKLVDGGFLYVLEPGGGRRKATRYRFLFPDCVSLFESRRKPSHDATCPPETVANPVSKPSQIPLETVAPCDTEPKGTQEGSQAEIFASRKQRTAEESQQLVENIREVRKALRSKQQKDEEVAS